MRLVLATGLAALLAFAAAPAQGFDWIGKIELDAEGLRSPDANRRYQAVQKLQRYKASTVEKYFLQAVRDNNNKVRKLAGQWLGKHKVRAAVPTVVEWLNEPDPQIKELAADILGQLGGAKAIKALIRSLGDIDERVRLQSVKALGRIGSPQVVVPLVGRLEDDKHDVRAAAVAALGEIGDRRAVIPLVGAFSDVSIKVRIAAIHAVGKLGDTKTVPALLRLARSPTEALRSAAIDALGNLQAAEAVDLLVESLHGTGRYTVRNQVANALGKIAKTNKSRKARRKAVEALIKGLGERRLNTAATEALRNAGKAAVPVLISSLEASSTTNPASIVELLRDAGDPRATPVLIAELDRGRIGHKVILEALAKTADRRALVPILGLLAKKDPTIRLAAMKALRPLLGPEARAADDVLIGLLADTNDNIRRLTAKYLGLMRSKRAVPKLMKLVRKSTKLPMRFAAVTALGEIGDAKALPLMLELLRKGPAELQRPAANAIIYIGDTKSVTDLLAIGTSERSRGRLQAVRAIGGVLRDRPDERARVALEKLTTDDDLSVSLAAIAALGAMKAPASTKALAALARSYEPHRRRAAVEALGNLGDKSQVPVLLKALRARDDHVAGAAAWALGKLEAPSALPDLLRSTRRRGWATSINASAAAARYAHIDRLDQLLPLLHHRIRFVRVNAAYVVGRLKAVPARRTLVLLLQRDPSWLVRQAAARALGQIGGATKELTKASKEDQREAVRKAAKAALTTPFKPPARSDWRNFYFVDPDNAGATVKQAAYFVAAADGLVTALYTDARGEAAEEKFPPGKAVIATRSRAGHY
jgi:HEAT repeat protein